MIRVFNKFEPIPPGFVEVDTTSKGPFKDLSPFFLGPVQIREDDITLTCQRFENLWQYSKVYPEHSVAGDPTYKFFEWREIGFLKNRADRYPMGKGAKPLYSWWKDEKLDYISARKKIYLPIYTHLVIATRSYEKLYDWITAGHNIALRDFDGYDHQSMGMSFLDVVNNLKKPMGHAFIIYGLLTGHVRINRKAEVVIS